MTNIAYALLNTVRISFYVQTACSPVDGKLACYIYSFYSQLLLDYSDLHCMVRCDGLHRIVFWWKNVIIFGLLATFCFYIIVSVIFIHSLIELATYLPLIESGRMITHSSIPIICSLSEHHTN